jgi:putative ABC transport system permease protein
MKVVATIEDNPFENGQYGSTIIVPNSTALKLIQNNEDEGESYASQIGVFLKNSEDEEVVEQKLESLLSKKEIRYQNRIKDIRAARVQFVQLQVLIYGFVSVITLIGVINIANTVTTSILLRKKELSMLQAIGMTPQGIRRMIATEGVLYGLIGAIFGVFVGIGCSYILFRLLGGIRDFPWEVQWVTVLIAAVGAVLLGLLSSLFGLRRLRNQNVIENIRDID